MIKATYIDHMGSDMSVVNAARVSFGKQSKFTDLCHNCGERAVEKYEYINLWECKSCFIDIAQEDMKLSDRDIKLIRYLAKHNHISPFGHAFASFHVKAPIFVARQLVKHKFLRWNEISRRYVDDLPEYYYPETYRGRSADKKQGSEGEAHLNEYQHNLIKGAVGAAFATYHNIIRSGVAPEQARSILPQGTMTEWYWSGSLDAFANMCNLRLKEDTQYESRLVAQQISEKMAELFPASWASLVTGGDSKDE